MTPDSTDPKAVADANCIAWAKRDRLLDEVVFDPTIHYCPETDEKAVTDFRYRRFNEPPVSKNWFHTRINYLSFRRFDGRQVRTAITGTVRTVDGRPVVDVVLNRLNSNQVGDTIRFLVVHFIMSHCYAANSNAFPRRTTGQGYGNGWKKFVNSISIDFLAYFSWWCCHFQTDPIAFFSFQQMCGYRNGSLDTTQNSKYQSYVARHHPVIQRLLFERRDLRPHQYCCVNGSGSLCRLFYNRRPAIDISTGIYRDIDIRTVERFRPPPPTSKSYFFLK